MKIGILTFHRALNYGAVLQCYSLSEILRAMGHDVEVIDYRPAYIEKHRKIFNINSIRREKFIGKLKTTCLIPITYVKKRKASQAFDNFLKHHLHMSARVFNANDVPPYYDVIIFGSDQIWSPTICKGFDSIFWGKVPKRNTRFVCYAPSLENYQNFTDIQWNFILRELKNFDSISVREKAFKDELEKRSTREVDWVLDPTLLVSPKTLKQCLKKPAIEKYIFLFTVQPGSLPYEISRKVAKEKGWKIVRARATKRLSEEEGVIQLGSCSPEEFLGLIYYAECIVTNSFHATAISIQFGKKIFSAQCERSKRIKNILDVVGLQDRYVTCVEDVNIDSSIDYNDVKRRLEKFVIHSYEYLQSSLS